MASMVFASSPLSVESTFVKRLRTNSKYSGSSWVPKLSIKVLSYKNISVESSKSSFILQEHYGFSGFSLPKSSRVQPISKSPSLNAFFFSGAGAEDISKSIYRFTVKQNGNDISLQEYKGKILLIVNIPEQGSQWTNSQIKYLNGLLAEYNKKGFEILGFLYDNEETRASDDREEIIEKEEIIEPQFQIFDKVKLNDKHIARHFWGSEYTDEEKRKKDVWYFLKKETPGGGDDVKEAFEKFIVDSDGIPQHRYPRFPTNNPKGWVDQVKEQINEYFN